MNAPADPDSLGYDSLYREFDSPLMRGIRQLAYGEDIGQHSWVTAEQLRAVIARLGLTEASRLLDLGCGPCGPLTFMVRETGCRATGIEKSAAALDVGRARAARLEIDHRIELREADLDDPLFFANGSFDAVMALDVVLHLRDRAALFEQVAGVLVRDGRFLFTDAGVVTGAISDREVERRSRFGFTQFSAPDFNERLLERTGLRLIEREDRTASLLKNASGRIKARLAHRNELEALEGEKGFALQQEYLETVLDLAARGALSRFLYLAEAPGA
jgi:SAM-dependent methyltransferase